jgi:hypothetical protein
MSGHLALDRSSTPAAALIGVSSGLGNLGLVGHPPEEVT